MKTKVTVLGTEQKSLRPIEFIKSMNSICDDAFEEPTQKPSEWGFIELITSNYMGYDIMFAHDGDRNSGVCLYLGHFNDGIV